MSTGMSELAATSGGDLTLGLAGRKSGTKRQFLDSIESSGDLDTTRKPPSSKEKVVGWPPVRSYRKNTMNKSACNASNERNVTDPITSSDHVPTYEDKDGDWRLVGDVPWKMFVETCKRIRLMKSSEAVNQLGCLLKHVNE